MSVESDLLPGLLDLVAPDGRPLPGTLFQLSDSPDEQLALSFTRGPTDPFGRWGSGVLVMLTRGNRADPLSVHDLADPLAKQLAAVAGATFGTVTVNWVDHRGASTGSDSSKRMVRADTFFVDFDLSTGYQA